LPNRIRRAHRFKPTLGPQKKADFKSFYVFAYEYSKEDGQKVVGMPEPQRTHRDTGTHTHLHGAQTRTHARVRIDTS
jgi:hypothetical protein